MSCLDVNLQISWMRKGFPTRTTFIMSFSFMICVDVFLQTKLFATRITFVISSSWTVLICIFKLCFVTHITYKRNFSFLCVHFLRVYFYCENTQISHVKFSFAIIMDLSKKYPHKPINTPKTNYWLYMQLKKGLLVKQWNSNKLAIENLFFRRKYFATR